MKLQFSLFIFLFFTAVCMNAQTDSISIKLAKRVNNDPYPTFVGKQVRTVHPFYSQGIDSTQKKTLADLKTVDPFLYERKVYLGEINPTK
jgi:hypothetical protein